LEFQSCSDAVGEALGADVMRSVKALLPDLLAAYPLLLYQGMWDAQDGAASSEAWIYGLDWEGREGFAAEQRRIVRARDLEEGTNEAAPPGSLKAGGGGSGSAAAAAGWHTQRQLLQRGSGPPGAALRGKHGGSGERVVAYWKQGGHLTHVVLPDAGHMVPRDAPLAARFMLESWLAEALK
jgi:vitellogenic carboxypeptidase-like protein